MLWTGLQLFIRQQTSVINTVRAHMAEFGTVARGGRLGVERSQSTARLVGARPRGIGMLPNGNT